MYKVLFKQVFEYMVSFYDIRNRIIEWEMRNNRNEKKIAVVEYI